MNKMVGPGTYLSEQERLIREAVETGKHRRPANLVSAAVQGESSAVDYLQENFPKGTIVGEGHNIKVSELNKRVCA